MAKETLLWYFVGDQPVARLVEKGDAKAMREMLANGAKRCLPHPGAPLPTTLEELAGYFDLSPPFEKDIESVGSLVRELRAFAECAKVLKITSVDLPLPPPWPACVVWSSRPLRREELPGQVDESDVERLVDAVGDVFGFDARRAQAEALAASGAAS